LVNREALGSIFLDRRGWFEEHNYRWENDGSIGHGSGQSYYLLVFFPAVRLALHAAGQKCGWNDPGFTWMQRRRQAVMAVKDIVIPQSPQGARRTAAIGRLSQLAGELPEQEIISATVGQLLLEDGQLENAFRALNDALASPLCEAEDRAGVLYNLACYFSRIGDEDSCQRHLRDSNQLKRLDPNWLEKDPDLETIRNQSWFQNFVASIRAKTIDPANDHQ
jgi:hypothetical protein